MRKAAHPSDGMGSLNPCRWRGKRLHHGGGVCLLFVQKMWRLVWLLSLVVCRQVPQDNLKIRVKTLLFAPPTRAPRHLCVLDTVCYSLGLHPFSALNPDCFICMIWDSPWYLVSTSGWYHHVCCILYTNDVILGTLLRILTGSVGVACSPMLPVGCGGIGCEPVSSICHSSSWWGCEYSTFCWQNYTVNFAVSCCIWATLLTGWVCQ